MALSTPAIDLPTQEKSGITIKQEKDDEDSTKNTNPTKVSKFIGSDPQLSGLQSRNITITVAASQTEKVTSPQKPTVQIARKSPPEKSTSSKSDPPPIDYSSICGAFGWTTIGTLHFPVIMRGEEKFIAVRMFESKIVFGYFPDIFPAAVFSCTNINSYYITVNEAKLLNEINSDHCDFQFGFQEFSTKDYVVRLKDAMELFEFLEFCRAKLYGQSSNTVESDKCGYLLNYKIPYVKKRAKKYVLLNAVFPEDTKFPIMNSERITNWDLAYFRFLSCFLPIDLKKVEINGPLYDVEDLMVALGVVSLSEVSNWPEIQCSSKDEWESFLYPRTLQWMSPVKQSSSEPVEDPKMLRKKLNEIQDKESMLNSFLGLNKYLEMNSSVRSARSHESGNGLNLLHPSEKTDLFPVSLDSFLATSSSCNYPYPVNYNHYNSHIQTPSVLDYERYRKSDGNLSSFSSRRPRTFPPPPPLVRLGSPRVSSVPSDQDVVPKTASSIYPYIPTPSSAPPWLSRIMEPDWLHGEENQTIQASEGPENLSRRLSESDSWCPTTLSTNMTINGAGSSSIVRSNSNPLGVIRENYDLSHGSLCRDERMLHPHGGSPRLLAGPGPPPHYPTPPQSSPLQPISLLECATGFTDIYSTRLTPNVDICSPPPSPEMRTALSSSPRNTHLSMYGYQPHIVRLVQVDTKSVLAINIEPLKYNVHLAVPITDVVNKFLRGTSVQSCQMMLETVFRLHLYECTRQCCKTCSQPRGSGPQIYNPLEIGHLLCNSSKKLGL
ncbi:hypothetical protein CDAR_230411 [Caerostris darwini]|uniref:Uncharacterized protein n=1 Tax=Caerostris darwini TaxID=1538125 RepID=A0AAV4W9D2_9ARAC|nr:hypothetical protein CDAR_230411 [Caerostris darwini]